MQFFARGWQRAHRTHRLGEKLTVGIADFDRLGLAALHRFELIRVDAAPMRAILARDRRERETDGPVRKHPHAAAAGDRAAAGFAAARDSVSDGAGVGRRRLWGAAVGAGDPYRFE